MSIARIGTPLDYRVNLVQGETVADLKRKLAHLCSVESQRLVFSGRILKDQESVEEAGLLQFGLTARVYLAPTPNAERPPVVGPPPSATQPVPTPTGTGSAEGSLPESADGGAEEPSCRVCFGTGGRLIRPCSCRGSMEFVHMDCLNEWRVTSVSPTAYSQCDQCQFTYLLQTHPNAVWLHNDTALSVISCLTVVILVYACGLVFRGIEQPFYNFVHWHPADLDGYTGWLWSDWFDQQVSGIIVVGVAGIGLEVWKMVQENTFDVRSFGLMILLNEERVLRILVAFGLLMAYRALLKNAREMCKRQLTKWGEIILEPSAAALAAPEAEPEAEHPHAD